MLVVPGGIQARTSTYCDGGNGSVLGTTVRWKIPSTKKVGETESKFRNLCTVFGRRRLNGSGTSV